MCCAFEDVAYLFGEFAKDFVYFPHIRFEEGDHIAGISYA